MPVTLLMPCTHDPDMRTRGNPGKFEFPQQGCREQLGRGFHLGVSCCPALSAGMATPARTCLCSLLCLMAHDAYS